MKRSIVAAAVVLALCAGSASAEIVRREFPGGLYGDALPSGSLAVGMGDQVVTHRGPIAIPDGHPFLMFLRITDVPEFKIAGKANVSFDTFVWREHVGWSVVGRVSHGVQGHCWTPSGDLFVVEPREHGESQGCRYWDGGPVLGSPTYAPTAEAPRLFGWTKRGDVVIGQGEAGGAVAYYGGRHYLIEPGDTHFVQFHRAGDRLSVAITKLAERAVVLFWFDVADLERFPLATFPAPDPVPAPVPVPEPVPAPDPVPVPQPEPASLLETVRQVRAKYGSVPSDPELCAIVNEVAWIHRAEGWGVSRKPWPTNCHRSDGEPLAHDILHHKATDTLFDVLSAAGASADPQWARVEHHGDARRPWVAPIEPGTVEPQPCPSCPPDQRAEVDRLRAEILTLHAALDEAIRSRDSAVAAHDAAIAQRDDLQRRLDAILAEPVRCEAKLFGLIAVPCRVVR